MGIKRIFEDLFPKIYPEIKRQLPGKHVKKRPKAVPEAFPEYPEITNKPVRSVVQKAKQLTTKEVTSGGL